MKSTADQKPDVFAYLDFRVYCKDYLDFLRQARPAFRFQTLVEQYGLHSRSHYLDILKGRKLTKKFLPAYIALFEFDPLEAGYFKTLVDYGQAADGKEKARCFAAIQKRSPNLETVKLEQEAFSYFSRWYFPVMLSVLDLNKRERDHRKLAACFKPRISALEAKRALAELTGLGFISWNDARGEWNFHRKFLKSTDSALAAALGDFHRAMQHKGIAAYESDFEAQTFSSLTLSVSLKTKNEIDAMITNLRNAIMEKAKADLEPEVALHINFQSFEVSKPAAKTAGPGKGKPL
jgi:uncharacterized protein (TIGR02147 family)